ncbi:hypothetical protein OG953_42640 [Streptomyces sp. NBC_00057]
MAALPLPSSDAQLLAAVIAIRAARGGTGKVTAADLRSLRLDDADRAVAELRGLGWQVRRFSTRLWPVRMRRPTCGSRRSCPRPGGPGPRPTGGG